jgi:hypothetical protein
MDLVGFVGFQNSGKNTAALPLEELGYIPISFADSLKDCLSAIFQWPREMIQGTTPESRAWREQVDPWWADRLGIPDFTPRMAMQRVGTEALRRHFNQDIWVASVEKKLDAGGKFVFTDLRYPNEIDLITSRGGKIIRIKKGPEPEWFDLAKRLNQTLHPMDSHEIMMETYPEVHETEYAWIGSPMEIIENDSTIEVLHQRVLASVAP